MINTPWLLHDAEVALWPAWQDGMPFHGPGTGRDVVSPLLHCKASLSITGTYESGAMTGHGWTAAEAPREVSWQIAIDFPDGAFSDDFGRLMSRIHPGGFRILTVRFFDQETTHWTLLSFFYVTPATDADADSAQVMNRAVTLKSSWLQERAGSGDLPPMAPVVLGELDWICGARRVTAMLYDPATETWSSTSQNAAGDGSRHVTLTPMTDDESADVILAFYQPRLQAVALVDDELPTSRVKWQNTVALRIGNHVSESHHGLTIQAGHTLQAIGIAEPLVKLPQDRLIDESFLVFRYLRRVYATLGHGVLAVPRLVENEAPPVSHDPAFRIAATGPANPATGRTGLVLLPNGAWLDGTVLTIP